MKPHVFIISASQFSVSSHIFVARVMRSFEHNFRIHPVFRAPERYKGLSFYPSNSSAFSWACCRVVSISRGLEPFFRADCPHALYIVDNTSRPLHSPTRSFLCSSDMEACSMSNITSIPSWTRLSRPGSSHLDCALFSRPSRMISPFF